MTPDERIEKLLNRAGQTISDLPKRYEQAVRNNAFDVADHFGGSLSMTQNFEDYILHLTDVIDRLEWALDNQVTLHENLMHVIANADIPEGVSYEQFCLVTDSIYKAIQTAQEGWENYEAGVPKDWSVDDD